MVIREADALIADYYSNYAHIQLTINHMHGSSLNMYNFLKSKTGFSQQRFCSDLIQSLLANLALIQLTVCDMIDHSMLSAQCV